MSLSLSSLHLRLLSGFTLGPLVLLLVWLGGWFFAALSVFGIAVSLYEWYGLAPQGKIFKRFLHMAFGIFYFLICFGAIIYLRIGFEQGALLLITAMLCIAASDTGAYAAGKLIGGPKLVPKISPNKTWAGLGGAVFFFGVALAVCGAFMPLEAEPLWALFLAGSFLGFVGQTGDLFMSSFKRKVGLKDTGNLIPGHGGILDRIDAFLLVCPAFLFLLVLWLL